MNNIKKLTQAKRVKTKNPEETSQPKTTNLMNALQNKITQRRQGIDPSNNKSRNKSENNKTGDWTIITNSEAKAAADAEAAAKAVTEVAPAETEVAPAETEVAPVEIEVEPVVVSEKSKNQTPSSNHKTRLENYVNYCSDLTQAYKEKHQFVKKLADDIAEIKENITKFSNLVL